MRETRVLCEVVLTNQDKEVLILRRSEGDVRRPGQWDVPGGHTDPGESLEAAAARELYEEAGIAVEPKDLRLVYAVTGRRQEVNVVWLFFAGRTNQSQVTLSHEHSKHQWAGLDQAIEMIEYDLQRDALRYIRDNGLLETT
jgi:8-oxo-dGTP diphosphatase